MYAERLSVEGRLQGDCSVGVVVFSKVFAGKLFVEVVLFMNASAGRLSA